MSFALYRIKLYLQLCKLRISLLAALSGFTGFMLSSRRFEPPSVILAAGILLLASGSGGLNQATERELDGSMPRTRGRPIPSRKIECGRALYFSSGLIISGLFTLFFLGPKAPLLGIFGILWYNGLYTFLKKKTAFAVFPGALAGTVPILIGWVAAGGEMLSPRLLMIWFLFFIWQVPHSWLSMVESGDEYKRAGLPCITTLFTKQQLARINFVWISAVGVSSLFLLASGEVKHIFAGYALYALSFWLFWSAARMLRSRGRVPSSLIFRYVNFYMLFLMAVLAGDKLFS